MCSICITISLQHGKHFVQMRLSVPFQYAIYRTKCYILSLKW